MMGGVVHEEQLIGRYLQRTAHIPVDPLRLGEEAVEHLVEHAARAHDAQGERGRESLVLIREVC